MMHVFAFSLLLAFGPPPPGDSTGIEGLIYIVSGNQMPAPGHKPGPRRGLKSTLYIFELTNSSQVVGPAGSPYYSAIKTRMLRQEDTDDNGYFRVLLPPGWYSLLTKKGDLYYAGRRDERNNIAPVEVKPGEMTKVDCSVESDHKVVY